ncbi:cell division cycle-associated protein 2 isoform X2 [Parambassis ranga]|uniref:Cell division cycle-associated protein 2 isoform X2 n=1 Tax=Parambassis ranga TaxID=210632 RepID=A0A6P7J3M3_9TELE|nr:cell division cycle-associated protein 2-like isoform X2 [Parambassis ranga]
MAKKEMDTTMGDQEEKISPSEEDTPPVLNETSAPLNFCEMAPSDFGISLKSFTPASSNHKDKSRLAQIKARRRSCVGVRGSPVTNSLIRFIAQQKMKTPPTPQTPELVGSSPFLPQVASTLRQKMASFQSLMDVEESDASDPLPAQDSNTGGCIKTRDYLSDRSSLGGGKENNPLVTPTPRKRRRLGPVKGCSVEIREASTPILHSSLKEQEVEEQQEIQAVKDGPLSSSETVEEAQAVFPQLHVEAVPNVCSPTKTHEDGGFELQKPSQPLPDDPEAAIPPQHSSPFQSASFPSLLEVKPTGEDGSAGASTVKKKRVRFGGPLSPEFFDKNLPPSTPLQKGGTPALSLTPGGREQLRSVLKTPQRSEQKKSQPQPDLISPTALGSPVLSIPHHRRMPSQVEEDEEKDEKIVFPSIEDLDSAVTSDTECTWDAQPLNLNITFHEESLSQTVTDFDTEASTPSQTDVPDQSPTCPEETQPEAHIEDPVPAPSSHRRKKVCHNLQFTPATEEEPTLNAPARSTSRKRKQSEESEPVKRSTRSAAKSASGKMKLMSNTTRQWSKDVDRSLYGSREHASKNPTLSPITESLSFISRSPAAPQAESCTVPNQETQVIPEMADDNQAVGDLAVTDTLERSSEVSVPSPKSHNKSTIRKGRSLSGLIVGRRGLKKRKVSVAVSEEPQDQTTGQTDELCEDQTTTSLEVSKASVCPPSAEQSSNTELAQRKAKRGKKNLVNGSVQQNHTEERQINHDLEEKAQEDQAAVQQENIQPISDSQEERGAANADLASWQADFNFEDVFKPVATRGQQSVRRSLRNQSNTKQSGDSAGLAWMTRTSPISSKEARRKSQGPQLRPALPVQSSLPAETQDT